MATKTRPGVDAKMPPSSSSVNKRDLANAPALRRRGFSAAMTARMTERLFDAISGQLQAGGRVEIRDFGTFFLSERAARFARNPRTGEVIEIPAKRVPRFRPGRRLAQMVNAD
ncbi:MAG: HU family DNA-binding protein [Gammaproteobacteria bacterium]